MAKINSVTREENQKGRYLRRYERSVMRYYMRRKRGILQRLLAGISTLNVEQIKVKTERGLKGHDKSNGEKTAFDGRRK